MHQTKKANRWYFSIKAYSGIAADTGLVHMVVGTAINVHDVTQAQALMQWKETAVFANAGY